MSLKCSASRRGDLPVPPASYTPHPTAAETTVQQHSMEKGTTGIHAICHLIASREHGELEKHVADLSRWQAHHTDAQIAVIAHPRYRDTLDEKVNFIPLNTDRSRHHPTLIWRLANHIRVGKFQIAHGHGGKSAQLLAAVRKYTDTHQVITRHNVRHPRDKLASAFDARIAVSRTAVAKSRLDWNVIPNGTDIQTQIRSTPEIQTPPPTNPLVAVRLVKFKGINLLLKGMAEVPEVRFILLGDRPDSAALQQQSGERIPFTGHAEKISLFMRTADLVVIPSNEGARYALAEALRNHRPVLSSRDGNAEEYIPAAYLLDSLEPAHVAEKLRYALTDRNKLREDFTPSFERADRELTLDNAARAVWQVYTQLIS